MAWHSRFLRVVASSWPILVLVGGVAGQSPPPSDSTGTPRGELAVRIRAKVNGSAIFDEELRDLTRDTLVELNRLPEPQRSALQKQVLESALESLIEREVILSEIFTKLGASKQGEKVLEKLRETAAKEFNKEIRLLKKRANCETDDQFKEMLRKRGQTLEGMKRQFERTLMAREYMRYLVLERAEKYGLPDARDYFYQHQSEFKTYDGVKWQDIFISAAQHGNLEEARRVALGILAQARAGADFAKLAQRDEGTSQNGEGYGKRRGEIRPVEAEPHLFQMREGDVRLVALPSGIHIIKLVKREYAGVMPFDDKTQKFILNKLKGEAAEREWKKIIKDFKAKAVIERDMTP
jgi:hypothetical protein